MTTALADDERLRALELVARYGFEATAFQTLEPGYSYFFVEDGFIAYVDTGRAWVVAGAPITAPEALAEATRRFLAIASANRKRCCFFATEAHLLEAAGDTLSAFRIGEQPVWDPSRWPLVLATRRSLREQLRRARAKGVTVRRLGAEELRTPSVQAAMSTAVRRWLSTRSLPPLAFLVQVEPFIFPEQRVTFIAEHEGKLVGFASVVPVPARDGWFLEDLVRCPNSPNGTNELLVDAVMSWASSLGCRWLTLGLAPLAGKVALPLTIAKEGGAFLYDFEGLRRFKAKLNPTCWSPIYLAHPPTQSALSSLLDALVAFTRVGFFRFGLHALLRGPTPVLRALTLALVPWTVLLASAPAIPWFGSALVKWAWVSFDALLFLALLVASKRPSPLLLSALAGTVALDASLTLLQALFFNLPRATRALDYVVILVACLAPLLAAMVLWGASRRALLSRR